MKKHKLNELESIEKFSGGVTHELNTPLTYTLANVELLISDIKTLDDSIETKSYLIEDANTILDGLHRITNVVELLKELSFENSEIPQDSDIVEILKNSLTLLYNHSKPISKITLQDTLFDLNFEKEIPKIVINAQKNRLETLFKVIILNALDALKRVTEVDDRVLKITILNEINSVTISFQDNGLGIGSTVLKHLFQDVVNDRKDGGMGIGLKVAKDIVKAHKGKISATNSNGGALFKITLPL
ncbi:MAG: GHKL domain-containing protein [Helicobacteraceae bacterium]|nr:GHKL domain-containing protein [Helicobacteraceae bacterium]